jgi:hypothetical protein
VKCKSHKHSSAAETLRPNKKTSNVAYSWIDQESSQESSPTKPTHPSPSSSLPLARETRGSRGTRQGNK